jgi:hypothetical protein
MSHEFQELLEILQEAFLHVLIKKSSRLPCFIFVTSTSIRFLISWGLQLIDLLTYPGGSHDLRLITYYET